MKTKLSLLLLTLLIPNFLTAEEFFVAPGESIQNVINTASNGDIISLSPGVYDGNIDFQGKEITVRGVGRQTVIRGDGNGSVVSMRNGETSNSILDSVRVTGGNASAGGGIYVANSSPTIIRNTIDRNRASSTGSGICVRGETSNPLISNNIISRNRRTGSGDPHGIQVIDGSPLIVNNSIVRNDSNGIHLSGSTSSVVMNNIIAFNGTENGFRRGRGICDFSSSDVLIGYNLFFDNEISALLKNGRDYKRIRRAEPSDAVIFGNIDRNPRFKRVRRGSLLNRSRAINRGNPDAQFNDNDGSRNDIGFTGGPEAIVK